MTTQTQTQTQTQPQSHTETFAALSDCFSTDLAALIGDETPNDTTPTGFIDLVERARDVLGFASVGYLRDAHDDLDNALTHLTDALTSPEGDQRSLMAWARTHLRDAIEATR
jgi:fumarate hydratase class II